MVKRALRVTDSAALRRSGENAQNEDC